MSSVVDQFSRPIRDLRVSVIDRCNFRCPYCMPKEVFGPGYAFLRDSEVLSLEELVRLLKIFRGLGVEKVRLTGGEPLLRKDVPELISLLKREVGIPEVALTTNGWLLEGQAAALRRAGLDRLNISLDSLRAETFARMNGLGFSVDRVLRGIDAAEAAGLAIKINMVVQRGINDDELLEMCAYFRRKGHTLRFIEFMDVGNHNGWRFENVVPARDIVAAIHAVFPLEPCGPNYRGEVAARYRYRDGAGEIGLISSVTEPFCRDCHRARLSADGNLFTCLFASVGWNLLGALRAGADDSELHAFIERVWSGRRDRYSDERAEADPTRPKVEMSYIGG